MTALPTVSVTETIGLRNRHLIFPAHCDTFLLKVPSKCENQYFIYQTQVVALNIVKYIWDIFLQMSINLRDRPFVDTLWRGTWVHNLCSDMFWNRCGFSKVTCHIQHLSPYFVGLVHMSLWKIDIYFLSHFQCQKMALFWVECLIAIMYWTTEIKQDHSSDTIKRQKCHCLIDLFDVQLKLQITHSHNLWCFCLFVI